MSSTTMASHIEDSILMLVTHTRSSREINAKRVETPHKGLTTLLGRKLQEYALVHGRILSF